MSKNVKKGGVPNPFDSYKAPFMQRLQKPHQTVISTPTMTKDDVQKQRQISGSLPSAVSLPDNLFIPKDAQSLDIRTLQNIPASTTGLVMLSFSPNKGDKVKIINYAVFFDALLFNLVNMRILVNKNRVFPYHGDPNAGYKIGLGTGSDLSNANLISCQLDLAPGDLLEVIVDNLDTVDVAMGVRFSGYVDKSTIRTAARFGG